MTTIRLGLALSDLGLPLKQSLLTASKLGVTGIELDARTNLKPSELTSTAVRQIRKMLNDFNLRVVAVRFQTRRGYGESEDLERRVEGTMDAMKMAVDLGCSILTNQIGRIEEPKQPSESGSDDIQNTHITTTSGLLIPTGEKIIPIETERQDQLRSVVDDLGRYGAKIGVRFCCETGSEPIEYLGDFLRSLPDAALGMVLNPGNLVINNFGIDEIGEQLDLVTMVRARDGVRDLATGRGISVELGRGTVDFPLIAIQLQQRDFGGFFLADATGSKNPRSRVEQSLEYLSNMTQF